MAGLDVKDVEEFIGMVQDVGAHRAALVSANGYSELVLVFAGFRRAPVKSLQLKRETLRKARTIQCSV
jgi:hypothetical protein